MSSTPSLTGCLRLSHDNTYDAAVAVGAPIHAEDSGSTVPADKAYGTKEIWDELQTNAADHEYSGNFKIRDLLRCLDEYPLNFPCRYANRMACHAKACIISNPCLSRQYLGRKFESTAAFAALLRRIHKVVNHTAPGQFAGNDTADYMDNPFITEWGRQWVSRQAQRNTPTVIPDFGIEEIARCLLPAPRICYDSPEGRAAFERWKKEYGGA